MSVNGKRVAAEATEDGYLRLRRAWKSGDVVEWTLPMAVRAEAMPDDPHRIALMFGPVVLVARHREGEEGPEPVVVPGRLGVAKWLRRVPGKTLRFRSQGVLRPRDLDFVPFAEATQGRYTTYLDRLTAAQWRERERAHRAEAASRAALERASVDVFRPGEMQPERDHGFEGERTETGAHMGRKWRHAVDGWFSFRMKVDPKAPQELLCDYWSGDAGREFDILLDGEKIATQRMEPVAKAAFIEVRYRLPENLTRGKTRVTLRFVARPGSIAGGLYGARIVRPDLLKRTR